ncbi:hypothetical protein EJ02DRAFT_465369 [Clathrospora elynae]|uniref:Uncharacterized protein n=1 Tax=Clathrospora elynae TaxID=706981 RepID=A0A6A5ST41_9PLEO|nr:hypothetical protein EJ02DRAFT_465369 [Clathrospora elynae]
MANPTPAGQASSISQTPYNDGLAIRVAEYKINNWLTFKWLDQGLIQTGEMRHQTGFACYGDGSYAKANKMDVIRKENEGRRPTMKMYIAFRKEEKILSWWVTGELDLPGPRTLDSFGENPDSVIRLKALIAIKRHADGDARVSRAKLDLPKPVSLPASMTTDPDIESFLDSL